MKKYILLLISSLLVVQMLNAQVLESEIDFNGIVVPRLDHTTVNIPEEGQVVYDINTESLWLYRSNNWKELDMKREGIPKNVIECGAVADRVTDNTSIISDCIDELNLINTINGDNLGWELFIPRNVLWDFDLLQNLPDDYVIYDHSTFDWQRPAPHNDTYWTAQTKRIIRTSNPGMKNANEFILISDYHPGIIIDNLYNYADPASEDFQASLLFSSSGDRKWRIGMGSINKPDFLIAGRTPAPQNALTKRLHILDDFGNYGFNGNAVQGISYSFFSPDDISPLTFKFTGNQSNLPTTFLFHHNNNSSVSSSRIRFDSDGTISVLQGGNYGTTFGSNQSIYAYRNEVEAAVSNVVLTKDDNKKHITNTMSLNAIDVFLPVAESGNSMRIVVTESQAMNIKPIGTDVFRSLNSNVGIYSNQPGNAVEIYCVVDGIWEINEISGSWMSFSY